MESPENLPEYTTGSIPAYFQAQSTGEPFDLCISCNTSLLENDTLYMIEKAFRRYPGYEIEDVVFEYAMCLDCLQKMQQSLSVTSLENIASYFSERVDMEQRYHTLMPGFPINGDEWTTHCIISGKHTRDLEEYQIYGLCSGKAMVFGYFPYMLSGEIMDDLSTLISKKTKDELDGFIDDHLGLPPELKKLFLDRGIMMF